MEGGYGKHRVANKERRDLDRREKNVNGGVGSILCGQELIHGKETLGKRSLAR